MINTSSMLIFAQLITQQAYTTYLALRRESKDVILDELTSAASDLSSEYGEKVELMKKLLTQPHDIKEAIALGNDVTALDSVVTAIYCFLR